MKGKQIAIAIFIIFMFADIVSTIQAFNSVGYTSSEINPIFIATNSFMIAIGMNLVGLLLFFWVIRPTTKPSLNFFYLALIIWLVVPRLVAVTGNNQLAENPIPEAENKIAQLPPEEKQQLYFNVIKLLLFVPLGITQFIFWLFSLDYKFVLKREEDIK